MLSSKTKKYINKEMLIYGIFALIGFVFFILTTFFNILKDEMDTVSIIFLLIGVIGLIVTYRMIKNPENTEKIVRIKTEERLQLIRYKTGYCTFWIIFTYIAVTALFSKYILISLSVFLSITSIAMAILYIIVSLIYHKIS